MYYLSNIEENLFKGLEEENSASHSLKHVSKYLLNWFVHACCGEEMYFLRLFMCGARMVTS